MKKMHILWLSLLFVLALTACGKKPAKPPIDSGDDNPIVDVKEEIQLSLLDVEGSGTEGSPYVVELYEDELIKHVIEKDKDIDFDLTIEPTNASEELHSRVTYRAPQDILFKALSVGENIFTISQLNAKLYILVRVKEVVIKTRDSIKILAIGNSFSEDSLQYLWDIANDYGIKNVTIGHLVIGGTSLANHATNANNDAQVYTFNYNTDGQWGRHPMTVNTGGKATIKEGLLSEDWDYITVQQVSGYSGIPSSYEPHLTQLLNYIKGYNNTAKLLFHMSWAYQQNSTHGDFPKYNSDQTQMYQAIVNAYLEVVSTQPLIDGFIPSGTAIQNTRTSYLGDTLTRDGFHLSYDKGRYLAGLTWFSAITGYDVEPITYKPVGVTNQDLKIFIESVQNAMLKPLEVTASSYN